VGIIRHIQLDSVVILILFLKYLQMPIVQVFCCLSLISFRMWHRHRLLNPFLGTDRFDGRQYEIYTIRSLCTLPWAVITHLSYRLHWTFYLLCKQTENNHWKIAHKRFSQVCFCKLLILNLILLHLLPYDFSQTYLEFIYLFTFASFHLHQKLW